MSELAELLFIKTSAGINQFESGRSQPSLETAVTIATMFGVSLEWLVGLAKEPYTEASIAAANIAKAERTQRVDPNDDISSVIMYLSGELGLQTQILVAKPSLELQGNYIFLINATILNDLEHIQRDTGSPLTQLYSIFGNPKPGRLDKRKIDRYRLFLKAHCGYFDKPIFNLSSND